MAGLTFLKMCSFNLDLLKTNKQTNKKSMVFNGISVFFFTFDCVPFRKTKIYVESYRHGFMFSTRVSSCP